MDFFLSQPLCSIMGAFITILLDWVGIQGYIALYSECCYLGTYVEIYFLSMSLQAEKKKKYIICLKKIPLSDLC